MSPRQFACLSILALSRPVAASDVPVDKYRQGNIIVAVEGGVVGQEIGNVVLALAKDENLLFTRPVMVAPADTACIMAAREIKIPPPCSAQFLQALDILNPKLKPSMGKLSVGQTVLLPDIAISTYRTARTFTTVLAKDQQRSATIQKNWSHLKFGVAKQTARTKQLEFDAYELIFRTDDPARQAKLMTRLTPLRSLNVTVTPIGFKPASAKAYSSIDVVRYEQDCRHVPSSATKLDYRDYSDQDRDLAGKIDEPANRRSAKVYLLDVKLVPTPNIADAVDEADRPTIPRQWQCAWTGRASRLQHATHLAGIIASRDNGFGFVGLSPKAKISSFDLLSPSANADTQLDIAPGKEAELADKILTNRSNELYLYLIAASLPKYTSGLNQLGQIDKNLRFQGRPVERRLSQIAPIVVVAAGQANMETERPIALSPTAAISPQNLGDLPNVLVVTACDKCMHNDASLMPSANYGSEPRYVHVAAPGGSPMLGWVDGNGIGMAQGTSQAAAYTAGVIAEMIGRWPNAFPAADLVKKRIQVTSWPMYQRPGQTGDDYMRLATGIVDPGVAMLDPQVTWIKDANGWRAIKLKGYSSDSFRFKRIGLTTQLPIDTANIARLTRVSGLGDPAQWVVYQDVFKQSGEDEDLGRIEREGPLESPANASLMTCDGQSIALTSISELLVANMGLDSTQCGS